MPIILLIFLGKNKCRNGSEELKIPHITESKMTFFIYNLLVLEKYYERGIAIYPTHSRDFEHIFHYFLLRK